MTIDSEDDDNKVVLRQYQARIVTTVIENNTIVVLPTGSGKTLIAAECAKQLGCPTLFLVPTCLLVEQQASAIRKHTGLRVVEHFGGKKLEPTFDILVSTPKAFEQEQSKNVESLKWINIGLVIFDEVHHVLKQHPYRSIAIALQRSMASPRILGLTASLTYKVTEDAMETQIRKLCFELCTTKIETATVAELQESGYHASSATMQVKLPLCEQREDLVPFGDRKPHLVYNTVFDRICKGKATEFAISLVNLIRQLEAACSICVPEFKSPLDNPSLASWGIYAHRFALRNSLCAEMEHFYEALRLLVGSWEEAEDAAVMFLRMSLTSKNAWPQHVQKARDDFLNGLPRTYPRYENLIDRLKYQLDNVETFRGIIFVQQRVSTHILEYVLQSDPELSEHLRTACIYAAASPATPSLTLTKSAVGSRIKEFAAGRVNCVIATTAAEEGMDIPEANCVIRFDPMVHSVSLVQGRGRARQADASFIVLNERYDRPAVMLEAIAQAQNEFIHSKSYSCELDEGMTMKLRKAQYSREANAHAVLWRPPSLALLNEYCQKTKVQLEEHYNSTSNGWECILTYESNLRKLTSPMVAPTKQQAKQLASLHLLQSLKSNI